MQQLINSFTLFPQYRGRFVYKMLNPIKIYNVKILKYIKIADTCFGHIRPSSGNIFTRSSIPLHTTRISSFHMSLLFFYRVFGLRPPSGILETRKHNVSETGCVSFRWTKSKNPVILSNIHHRQNPLESSSRTRGNTGCIPQSFVLCEHRCCTLPLLHPHGHLCSDREYLNEIKPTRQTKTF
jgi:hypothetical protein